MKCEACEFYHGDNHCWVNPKSVEPCPETPCERFKFDALIGECVAAERARCLEIVKQVCSAAVGSESTRAGVYLPEILAEEIERQIRGEK